MDLLKEINSTTLNGWWVKDTSGSTYVKIIEFKVNKHYPNDSLVSVSDGLVRVTLTNFLAQYSYVTDIYLLKKLGAKNE